MIRSPTIRLEEAALDFRLLGPLEVADGGRVLALGGAKQRALLAVLLLRANEVVSIDRLIDELWGDEPPPTAAKVVQVYVSQLRKALAQAGREPVIATRPPGYVARVSRTSSTSRASSASSIARAEHARPATRRRRRRLLRAALALWRGQALADFSYEPFAQPAIARLEELRLVALEERVESDLALGRDSDLVGEVEALVAEYPLREGLRGQLMLALYRSGRQAEALEAYQQARSVLVEELGIDPSPSLQELEKAILRQDPLLEPASAGRDDAAVSASAPSAPAAQRAILVAPRAAPAASVLLSLACPAGGGTPGPRALVLTKLLDPPAEGAATQIGEATASLREFRDNLADQGVVARVAAFTSGDHGADLVRLAAGPAGRSARARRRC